MNDASWPLSCCMVLPPSRAHSTAVFCGRATLRLLHVGRTLLRIERRWIPRYVTVEDERDLARIRELCRRFPEAAEGQLQDRPLFHVRRRRFALFNGDGSPARKRWREFGRSLHFVTDPRERDALARDPRYRVSPH